MREKSPYKMYSMIEMITIPGYTGLLLYSNLYTLNYLLCNYRIHKYVITISTYQYCNEIVTVQYCLKSCVGTVVDLRA